MPMYEYKCNGCEETFTIMQRMGAGMEGLSCPACKGTSLTKLISRTVTPDSEKAMPSDMEMAQAMSSIQKAGAGGCASGMCSGGSCSINEFGPKP